MMKGFRLILILWSCLLWAVNPSEAVLQSSNTRGSQQQDKETQQRQLISDYTQQVLYAAVLEKTSETMKHLLQNSNLGLLPQLVQLAIQQSAMQVFKQQQTMDTIRDIFEQCVDLGMADLDKGLSGPEVQNHIRETAKREVSVLVDDPVYREIMKLVIENLWQYQQQIVAQQVMQQQIEQMVKQQAVMQRAAEEQYRQQMQGVLSR